MIVELTKTIPDRLNRFTLREGARFIVYAIDEGGDETEYYLMTTDPNGRVYEPLPYPRKMFRVVDDEIPDDWGEYQDPATKSRIRSFREWLNPEFAIKAHDYDLGAVEFDTIRKYQQIYEAKWGELLRSPRGDEDQQ